MSARRLQRGERTRRQARPGRTPRTRARGVRAAGTHGRGRPARTQIKQLVVEEEVLHGLAPRRTVLDQNVHQPAEEHADRDEEARLGERAHVVPVEDASEEEGEDEEETHDEQLVGLELHGRRKLLRALVHRIVLPVRRCAGRGHGKMRALLWY